MTHTTYGKPDILRLVEVQKPAPGAGQIRVRVVAGSVNPIDWKLASGALRLIMPAKFPVVPGFDIAGVVDEVGPNVPGVVVGARVHVRSAKASGGGAADYAILDASEVTPMPDSLGFAEAAAIPLAGMTALQALRDQGGLPLTGA